MILSLKWLQNYIPGFEIPEMEAFKNKVDTRLTEVERVQERGALLKNLVIGEIKAFENHPEHKHLSVCTVDVGGNKSHQIVCGAPNVAVGLKSVVCLPGGRVYDPKDPTTSMEITARSLAGVESQGMLCAADELGLYPNHETIIELDPDSAVGTDVTAMFQDIVIEIENKALSHRPDAFSHLGIAQEISAIFKTKLEQQEPSLPGKRAENEIEVKVDNQAKDLCPRFSGITIANVEVKPSPLWLQIQLAYAGVRSVNNIVDITNYVMLDIGQPLHAFDISKLASNELIVRKAKKDEQLETIDHQSRNLPEGAVIIADKEGPIGVAGIMGGSSTEISEETKTIFLEAANWEMYSIRQTSRQLGLRSEAVTRFEKGIDPALTITAIQKAATMITDIAAGELASDIIDLYPEPERTRIVNLDMGSIKRRLGVEIEKSKIVDILRSLNFEFTDLEKVAAESINRSDVASTVQVHVPSYRRDIRAQEDLLEEIGRLFGYEYIPTTLPLRNLEIPRYNGLGALVTHLKKVSATSGLNEIYTYTMVGEELYRKAMVETKPLHKIMNPISPELAMIRTQLVPSILEKVELNHPRYSDFGLFEVSKVALTKEDKQTGLPEQPFLWAAARVGEDEHTVYRQLKYSIEQINSQICSHKLQITEETKGIPSYYHPGKTASVRLEDTIIGYIGVAHPQVVENFGLGRETLVIAELEVEPLLALTTAPKSAFKSLSNFPTVQRDISFWQQPHTYVQHTLDAINKLELELLKAVEVIDTYSEGDKTSTTLRVTMQSDTHTLEQSEITDVIETIQQVISKLKHELR